MKKFDKKLYYTLNWTWGIITTICGALIALVLMCCGKKPQRHGGSIYFEVGEGWGGMEFGCFFLCQKGASQHTKNHEYGHSLQNALWGPLFLPVIGIPSMIRYHHRRNQQKKGIALTTAYDDIWFEGQATEWGTKTLHNWQ